MKLKQMNPTTNGLRHMIKIDKSLLSKNNQLVKQLIEKKTQKSGRSSVNGKITVWHKGGGKKRKLRNIEFNNISKNSLILTTAYDPLRTSFINLNFELQKENFFLTTATNSIYPGFLIKSSPRLNELKLGYRSMIKSIPTGSIIHKLSKKKTKNAQYIRSAGTFGQIIYRDMKKAKIKLPSKKIIEVSSTTFATIGVNSNLKQKRINIGKAGTNRNLGIRPTVRGIAMNPVDHPHGGRTNGGRPSVTPWGLPTKNKFSLRKKKKI